MSGAGTKTEYSADSISRSYLEQQRAYYESAGLKSYPGYNGGGQDQKSGAFTPDSMSGRQSTESPDIKKQTSITPDPAAQAQALQAYYSQSMGMGQGGAAAGQSSSLPPLLPMAAQLSQYAAGSTAAAAASAGYSQPSAAGTTPADYSRRPLSVLF